MSAGGPVWHYAWASDPGRRRPDNEDAVAVHAAAGLAILADGMGGYRAGEVASRLAVEALAARLLPCLRAGEGPGDPELLHALQDGVGQANRAVHRAAGERLECQGMGTTLVVAVLRAGRVLLAHVGDSRAYRFGPEGLQRLTRDHSFVQAQVDAGLLSAEEAARSPQRNLITRALGIEAEVEAELGVAELGPGEGLMLCSDGLSDMLDDPALAALLAPPAPLQARVRRLIDAANRAGGRDNISVILAQGGPPPAPRWRWWPWPRRAVSS